MKSNQETPKKSYFNDPDGIIDGCPRHDVSLDEMKRLWDRRSDISMVKKTYKNFIDWLNDNICFLETK